MKKNPIVLVGAGGHARVVADCIEHAQSPWFLAGLIDESMKLTSFMDKTVHPTLQHALDKTPQLENIFVAIGNNEARESWHEQLLLKGLKIPTIVHPFSYIAPSSKLGQGTLICAGAIVGAGASIGNGVIINSGAVIDHDASVEAFSHVSQNSTVCGGASIGKLVTLGPGCIIEKMATVASLSVLPSGEIVATKQIQPKV